MQEWLLLQHVAVHVIVQFCLEAIPTRSSHRRLMGDSTNHVVPMLLSLGYAGGLTRLTTVKATFLCRDAEILNLFALLVFVT